MFATTGLKPGLSYGINTGTVSAVASSTPISLGIRTVRVVATQNTWVAIGPSPTATATTSVYLPASAAEYFQCSGSGNEKIAALEVTTTGQFNVTEMTS